MTNRNGYPWIPKEKRKKILLLSDDLRLPSGVGTMSREFVLGMCHYYNFVQIGAAINHPDVGKRIDISADVQKEIGVKDPSIVIYPYNGYGDENIIRYMMSEEKPDALLHYTDPRFFVWLYQLEHEIRQSIPIFYYTIWDDLPYPRWNEPFYESVDLHMAISKQTYGIVKNVVRKNPLKDWQLAYVPHGINEDFFYPVRLFDKEHTTIIKQENGVEVEVIKKDSELLVDIKKSMLQNDDSVEFVLLYVNRNIRRKLPGDVILAYKNFCDMLPKEKSDKCVLLMHTQPIDENGTDLPAVVQELCPYKVIFSAGRLDPVSMNILYNIADATINLSSNEGFGLGTCEGMMAGTPTIVNVTGGLQDQCGFKLNGKYLTHLDYLEIQTLHDRDIWKNNENLTYGEWVFPIWPSNRSLQGSPPTPYIFDDRPDYKEAAKRIKEVYDLGREERQRRGLLARDFVTDTSIGMSASEMSRRFIENMENAFNNWKPKKKFSLLKV